MGNVQYAENIDTVHGMAITVDEQIFFPTSVDLYSPEGFGWLLHELEHVGQYRVAGGREAFVTKYLFQSGMEIFTKGSFNVHDAVGLEREAIDKADRIFEEAYGKMLYDLEILSEAQAGETDSEWKGWYLDIDGNTGAVILWPNLGRGGHWRMTDHGDGTVSLQVTV